MKKKILFGQDARDALKRGIDLAADAVSCTLGPTGRNAVLGRLDLPPIITNDGAMIARNIEADDPNENDGVWIVKEASALADKKAGDGTTTCTVILQKLVASAFEIIRDDGSMVKNKVDTIQLKKQVDSYCELAVEALSKMSRPITDDDIYNVALVSAEYPWLAKMVADIYSKIGKDGYISIEESVKTGYEVYKGIELMAGYHSDYYINNDKRECVIEEPYILVTNQSLETTAIVPLIEQLVAKNIMSVIIIAPDFTRDLLSRLITTKVKAGFTAVALKLPTFDKDDILIDIATMTEAAFIDKNTFTSYENFSKALTFEKLGRAEKAIISDGKSVLIGGNGDTDARVGQLKEVHAASQSSFDRDAIERRIAYLSGGMAVIRIGGESDTERNYFKLKAEDTINAVQVALKDGVVPGGGLALKTVADSIEPNILTDALRAPFNQIQKNAGGALEIKDSVIDPVKITISALRSACSLAGMVITTEVSVAFNKTDYESKNNDEN